MFLSQCGLAPCTAGRLWKGALVDVVAHGDDLLHFTSECLTAPGMWGDSQSTEAWYHVKDAVVKHGATFSTFGTNYGKNN